MVIDNELDMSSVSVSVSVIDNEFDMSSVSESVSVIDNEFDDGGGALVNVRGHAEHYSHNHNDPLHNQNHCSSANVMQGDHHDGRVTASDQHINCRMVQHLKHTLRCLQHEETGVGVGVGVEYVLHFISHDQNRNHTSYTVTATSQLQIHLHLLTRVRMHIALP